MPSYKVKNISRILLYENLDTKDVDGKREVFALRRRETKTITDAQWQSRSIQRNIKKGRLRSSQA